MARITKKEAAARRHDQFVRAASAKEAGARIDPVAFSTPIKPSSPSQRRGYSPNWASKLIDGLARIESLLLEQRLSYAQLELHTRCVLHDHGGSGQGRGPSEVLADAEFRTISNPDFSRLNISEEVDHA